MKLSREIIENVLNNKVSLDFIFTLPRCESCDMVEAELERRNIDIEYVSYVENKELAQDFGFSSFPTLVRIKDGGFKYYQGYTTILDKLIKKIEDEDLEAEPIK